MAQYIPEPYRIKMVEPIRQTTYEERIEAIRAADYNMFSLASSDVYIDMLTDSGTNAMSDQQWAAMMQGDESYAGSRSYGQLMEVAHDIFNYEYIQPVHQGRAAEHMLFPLLLKKGMVSISNYHFDTTSGHVQLSGAKVINCVSAEAADTQSYAPFKGNMDTGKLKKLIREYGPENVGCIVMTITCNSAGGQPVSLANIKETAAIAREHDIPLVIDAARYAENAFFIKEREEGQQDRSIKEIVRDIFAEGDAFTMSAKKDGIVNIGGLVGVRENPELIKGIKSRVVPYEGFLTYGGLAGRDLGAMAVGLTEGMDEDFLRSYVGQTKYLGDRCRELGVPIQYPTGGHAIFVDARKVMPHIPYYRFPAHTLCVALYLEGGIRGCDIGSFILDPDPETGEQLEADLELSRFCIPRRTYTQAHLDYVAEKLADVMKRSEEFQGFEVLEQAKVLRHFTAKLKPYTA
ncbi:MAG: tryptophanase [Eubacteriales bacterium]|nr:tryptophanase [Eubacteriales bacterium]MDD4324067.1 tryptophanase [Eubacteriales bacterium]MDD4541339.1 tryptophanase [Eubacteriales bacterium]